MMFNPLSFKKFGRRLRSPFSLFKKRGKRSSGRKQKQNVTQVIEPAQPPVVEEPVTDKFTSQPQDSLPTPSAIPEVLTPATPSTATSSEPDQSLLPTPVTPSTDFGVTVRVQDADPSLQDLVLGYGDALQSGHPEEAPIPRDSKDSDSLPVITLKPLELPSLNDVTLGDLTLGEEDIQSSLEAAVVKAGDVETIKEEDEEEEEATNRPSSLAAEQTDTTELPSVADEEVKVAQFIASPVEAPTTEAPAPASPIEPKTTKIEKIESELPNHMENTTEPDTLHVIVVPEEPETVSSAADEAPAMPVDQTSSLTFPSHKDKPRTQPLYESPPASPSPRTPRLKTSPNLSNPKTPTTPTRRSPSGSPLTTPKRSDTEIMAEIQASVRAREKKRLEKEAAEKKRIMEEVKQAARKNSESAGVSEDGKIVDADKDDVLKEIRSWRKQREDSIKGAKEVAKADAAKTAAYRAASAGEQIMTELKSAAESRAARGPVLEDPREKRQLLLDEVFRSRATLVQAAS